jgi:monofunctional biosynthetic peptidoglycan transglycosylase
VPYSRISPHPEAGGAGRRRRGVLGSRGHDLVEIRKSLKPTWERGGLTRGASTITQQLAKNMYLSPTRNPMQEALRAELHITRRLEHE